MVKVLLGGKVVEMSEEECRAKGVLGGPEWDRRQDEYAVKRSHEGVLRGMDLDGRVFHTKMGRKPELVAADHRDESPFTELFEDPEYWG